MTARRNTNWLIYVKRSDEEAITGWVPLSHTTELPAGNGLEWWGQSALGVGQMAMASAKYLVPVLAAFLLARRYFPGRPLAAMAVLVLVAFGPLWLLQQHSSSEQPWLAACLWAAACSVIAAGVGCHSMHVQYVEYGTKRAMKAFEEEEAKFQSRDAMNPTETDGFMTPLMAAWGHRFYIVLCFLNHYPFQKTWFMRSCFDPKHSVHFWLRPHSPLPQAAAAGCW